MSQYRDEVRRQAGLAPRSPQQTALSRQEEEALAARLARAGISSVQYIGESIDKPMAAIRGALAGRPEELANLIPFSDALGITSSEGWLGGTAAQVTDDENTVYGRDLLETYGVLGKNKEGFGGKGSWAQTDVADAIGDVAGFGIDLIGLPVGVGAKALTKGGTALAKAGILDDVALAAAKAGKAPVKPAAMGSVSDAMAMSSNPLEALAKMSRTAKASGDDLSKLYNQRVGHTAALRAPLGLGRDVVGIDGVVDPLLKLAGKIPGAATVGQTASAVGRGFGGALSGRNQNMFSELGQQNAAPVLVAQREALERNARDVVSGVADTFNRNTDAFTELGGNDATTGFYKLYEGQQLGPTQELGNIINKFGKKTYDDLIRSRGDVRQALDTIPGIQHQLGVSSNALEDEFVNYMTRSVLGKPRPSLGGERTMAAVDGAGTLQRSDYLKNIPGGTATLREIAKQSVGAKTTGDIAIIARKLGVPEDQIGDLSTFFLELDPKVLEAGVYTDPINALSNRLMSAAKGQANASAAADLLGNQKLLARSTAQGGDTSTIGDVAQQLGVQQNTFLTETARRAGIDVDTGNLAAAAGLDAIDSQGVARTLRDAAMDVPAKSLETLRKKAAKQDLDVNDLIHDFQTRKLDKLEGLAADRGLNLNNLLDNTIGQTTSEFGKTSIGMGLAKDIANINPNVAGPNPMKPLLDAYDSMTSLFKGSVTSPFPAFTARNRVSGAVREMLAGSGNLRGLAGFGGRRGGLSDNIAAKVSRGMPFTPDEVAAVKRIPGITDYMNEGSSAEDALRRLLYRDMPGQGQGYALDTARSAVRPSAAQTPEEISNIGLAGGIGGTQGFSFKEAWDKLRSVRNGGANPMNQRGVLQGEGFLGGAGLKGSPRAETKFAPAAAGQYVGEHAENLNRIAPYLKRVFAGTDPARAAKDVLETQIDYSAKGLSKFENEYLTRLIPFYKFCVPLDHEILTKRGWKQSHELVIGETVMGFDIEADELKWTTLEAVNLFEHVGPLNMYKNRSAEFLYTDGHQWPIRTKAMAVTHSYGSYEYPSKLKMKTGDSLSVGDKLIGAADFKGSESLLSARHAAILGWLVTDGYHRFRGNYCEMMVYQSPKKYLEDVIELLGTKPRKPHPDTGVVSVPVSLEDSKVLLGVGFTGKESLPGIVAQLGRDEAEAMWQAMFDAEGTQVGANHNQELFVQSEKNQDVIDAYHILCVMTGRTATTSTQQVKESSVIKQVNTRKTNSFHVKKHLLSKVPFAGAVWCPTTSTGTWVMRHNGSIIITGNSRGNLPYVGKQLATDPSGRTAALVQASNAQHRVRGTDDQILPDYVAESLAIPLGTNADGSEQFLRGLGLMEEDIFGVFDPTDPIKGGLAEIGSRLNPIVKAPIELATNQSFFQKGRPLDQMDPTIGRLISNVQSLVTGEEQKLPAWQSGILDHVVANLPSARAVTTLRQLTDRRKLPSAIGGLEGNTGVGLLANLLTGVNVSDVSEGAMDKKLRDLVGDSYSSIGGRSFETIYLPQAVKDSLTPEQLAEVERLKALKRLLSQRRKQRALAAQ